MAVSNSVTVLDYGIVIASGTPNEVQINPAVIEAYFGAQAGWLDTPILRRSDLSTPRSGPLIVEEYDATCVVPPGAKAGLDTGGNIIIALG